MLQSFAESGLMKMNERKIILFLTKSLVCANFSRPHRTSLDVFFAHLSRVVVELLRLTILSNTRNIFVRCRKEKSFFFSEKKPKQKVAQL